MINRPHEPPKGFRVAIPRRVALAVLERQNSLCAACSRPLLVSMDGQGRPASWRGVELDHRPALTARQWDPIRCTTIPEPNDPAFLEALHSACHRNRTIQDIKVRAKTIRRQKAQDAFDSAMMEKEPGRKRPRKGTIRSRNTLRRRGESS